MKKRVIRESPVGPVSLYAEDGAVVMISFQDTGSERDDDPVLIEAEKEIREYFKGERKAFSFPWRLDIPGFEGKCLRVLSKVPFGETVSYGRLAFLAGSPRGARAAGNAVHKNPLPILIPCHRVILGDGRIGGFGGELWIKKKLLELEGANYRE